jgi:hypothetical protein
MTVRSLLRLAIALDVMLSASIASAQMIGGFDAARGAAFGLGTGGEFVNLRAAISSA